MRFVSISAAAISLLHYYSLYHRIQLINTINKALPTVATDKELALDTENNCEKLVKLVSVVGKDLERYPALKPGSPTFKQIMNKNFDHLADYASSSVLQPRVRFLIRVRRLSRFPMR
jgi:hypothetical protein